MGPQTHDEAEYTTRGFFLQIGGMGRYGGCKVR